MNHYAWTASFYFLAAQAAPLIVRSSIRSDYSMSSPPDQRLGLGISPYFYFSPSTDTQPTVLNLPTANQLFALNPSSEIQLLGLSSLPENQQPQDLNTVHLYAGGDTVLADSILQPSTTWSNVFSPLNGNQLAATEPAYIVKGCDDPRTCELCNSNDQSQCREAEVGTESTNGQKGQICPVGTTAQDQCIAYILYIPTGDCVANGNSHKCLLCDPKNQETCVPAGIQSKAPTADLTILYVCPQEKNTGINCVKYDSVTKCTSPDGTRC